MVLKVAVAVGEPLSVPVPRMVAPSLKVTVPVSGGTPLVPVIVAVKVTNDPQFEGLGDPETVVPEVGPEVTFSTPVP